MTEPAVIYIDCHCEADPDIPYDVAALCAGAQPGIFRAFVPPDALTFFAIDQLILFVSRGGYWPMAFESPGKITHTYQLVERDRELADMHLANPVQ